MKCLSFLILAAFASVSVSAQREATNWYFGSNSGVTFQGGAPIYLPGGMLNSAEGCAAISDRSTGALLFYTDGVTIWNSSHQIMPNGTGLRSGTSSTQSAFILPDPANASQYYVFTSPNLTAGAPLTSGFHYSLVSMATAGGNVITKNIRIADDVAEKVTATKDCDGNGYWVVTHAKTAGTFYAFHVTAAGVNPNPVISLYSPPVSDFTAGYIKISPNGAYLAVGSSLAGTAYLGLFDFDTKTGVVSNLRVLHTGVGSSFYGMSFSPDNSKLYATGQAVSPPAQRLFQFEVNAGDAAAIRASVVTMAGGATVNKGMQLGPDGKLYIATGQPWLDVVRFPNLKGSACSYQTNAIALVNSCQRGLPNYTDYLMNDLTPPSPIIKEICKGSSVQIGVLPVEGRTYSWSPTTGLNDPNIANPYASPTSTTEYVLTVSSPTNSCYTLVQRYIVNIRTTTAVVNANIPLVCAGQGVQLSASGGDFYEWSPGGSVNDPNSPNPIAKVKTDTRFRVVVFRNGCPDTAYVMVKVKPLPMPIVSEPKTICLGQSVRIGGTENPEYQYRWTPTTDLDLSTSANPTASPKKTTKYSLHTEYNGCTFDTSITVTVNSIKVGISSDVTICSGASVKLTASGGTQYLWSPSTGLNNKNVATPTATPTDSIRYKVIISDGMCTDSAFVRVNVVPLPKADAGTDKTVCKGVATQLGELPKNGCTYKWSPATELNDPNIANPIATPTQTRKYILTVTNANNCTVKDSVLVTIGTITAKVSPDTSICAGTTLLLTASGGSEYLWSPTDGLDNPTSSTPKATPTTTTRYTVRVSSGVCVDSASVQVTLIPLPTADAGKDIQLCPGEVVPIGAPAVPGYVYSWTPTDGLDNPQSAMPNCAVTTPMQYVLRVNNPSGCFSVDTVVVGVSSLQVAVSPDTTICPNASVRLSASGGTIYQWTPTDGLDDPTLPTPLASPATTTTYTVDVQNEHGCAASARVTVAVSSAFLAVGTADTAVCRGQSVQLMASGGSNYSWFPTAGLDDAHIPSPRAMPDTTTLYRVTASNGNCLDTAYVTVNVLPLPTAQAGNDTTICIGEAVSIGTAPITGHHYSWSPVAGLDDPNSARPTTQPIRKTDYILTEVNENGCVNYDTVTVDVRQRYELAFMLSPPVISLLPGEPFTALLHIPSGVQTWTAQLRYDSQIAGFDSIIQTPAQITASAQEDKGVLTMNGSGENGDILLGFHAYLPERLDTTLRLSLGITSLQSNVCDYVTTQGVVLQFGEFCAKNFRFVSGTGKKYFLRANEHGLEFGVGLTGRIRLELYDYSGRLRQVIADSFVSAGDYAVDIELPSGVYFYRMSAGLYQQVEPLVIIR